MDTLVDDKPAAKVAEPTVTVKVTEVIVLPKTPTPAMLEMLKWRCGSGSYGLLVYEALYSAFLKDVHNGVVKFTV